MDKIDTVWEQLMAHKASQPAAVRCTINEEEEDRLRLDIEAKLNAGWTSWEIFNHLKWTEYFDDYQHSEEHCLEKLSQTYKGDKNGYC